MGKLTEAGPEKDTANHCEMWIVWSKGRCSECVPPQTSRREGEALCDRVGLVLS